MTTIKPKTVLDFFYNSDDSDDDSDSDDNLLIVYLSSSEKRLHEPSFETNPKRVKLDDSTKDDSCLSNKDYLSGLPPELVANILFYLDQQIVLRMRLVSRFMKQCSVLVSRARVRNILIDLFGSSSNDQEKREKARNIAKDIEAAVFAFADGVISRNYRAKMRKLISYLRNRKSELHAKVFCGEICGEELVRLPDNELMSAERKKEIEEIRERAWKKKTRPSLLDELRSLPNSGWFRCERCYGFQTMHWYNTRRGVVDKFRIIVRCVGCGCQFER